MLRIKRPTLQIRRQEVPLNGADRRRGRRSNHRERRTNRDRLIHPRNRLSRRLQIRRIQGEKFRRAQRNLVIIDAIPSPNGSRALLKWIPGDPKARGKIVLLGLVDILAEWRGGWCAFESRRSSLEILGIHNNAVAVIARARTAESGSRYDWRIRRVPKTGKKVNHQTVSIPGRAIVRVANAIIQSQILPKTPFVLTESFNRSLSKINRQIEICLAEGNVAAKHEARPILLQSA